MNAQKFAEEFVTIDFVESSGCYGHYPYQMFVEMADESVEVNALALGDVRQCYSIFASKLAKQAKSVFMALDFPASGDMVNDFVAVFAVENGIVEIFAIPYDPATGDKKEPIKTSHLLTAIKSQFVAFIGISYLDGYVATGRN
ncbi:MAG TPA: hypothetical protein PLM07_04050 [Candidatus Rifleibacterium sp.]|nr:hypothetical protein [Candidatus Rifleibacterium sp.]HPT45058.1 hypothetical protein [Candidatus Rifleibacterium sp.]